jgi:RHS repeat-associated protein
VILLAEHEPSLAAKKKRRPVALEKATSPSKNRVWNFFGSALGRPVVEPPISSETATGSVQFSYETASGQAYYYTRDHLGSVREMLNSSGSIVARYSYDMYGRVTLVSGSNLATFQYAQMYAHQPSGLDLPDFRGGYDPTIGRWIERDRIAEKGGLNLYEYVLDNPVNASDPLGLCKCPCKSGVWTGTGKADGTVAASIVTGNWTGTVTCTSDSSLTASVSGPLFGIRLAFFDKVEDSFAVTAHGSCPEDLRGEGSFTSVSAGYDAPGTKGTVGGSLTIPLSGGADGHKPTSDAGPQIPEVDPPLSFSAIHWVINPKFTK